MTNEDLRKAFELIDAGEKKQAYEILSVLLKEDPDNEYAWVGLSRVLSKDMQIKHCLEQVLRINPNNMDALYELERMQNPDLDYSEDEDYQDDTPYETAPATPRIVERSTPSFFSKFFKNIAILVGIAIFLFAIAPGMMKGVGEVYSGLGLLGIFIFMLILTALPKRSRRR